MPQSQSQSLTRFRTSTCLAVLVAISFGLAGCQYRHAVDEVVEVGASETAFLIALDGDTLKNQKKFDSVEALNSPEVKIAVKRVLIPHKLLNVCPTCSESSDAKYKDVATAKLIKINRAMVSREWTSSASTGTTRKNQSISVESNESIDFSLGAVITAQITEKQSALFLYNFGGKQLEEIIDQDIRNYLAQHLSANFGTHTLEQGRKEKISYFQSAQKEATAFFAEKGITIVTFGSSEGMTYKDDAIQRAINKKFEAQMASEAASDQAAAASKLVANRDAVILQQNYEIRKQEIENQKAAIAKWDGHGATTMVTTGAGSGGSQLFNLPITVGK